MPVCEGSDLVGSDGTNDAVDNEVRLQNGQQQWNPNSHRKGREREREVEREVERERERSRERERDR